MKQKYLSLIALASAMCMSTSAWAQWDEPTAPELEIKNAASVEAGKTYYIMNVGAEQFITGANSWSTQVSLTSEGVIPETTDVSPALAIYVADSTGTSANLAGVTGVSLRLNGTYTVYGASGARTFTNTYLFRDSEESSFMDHGTQDKGYIWKITKVEETGYYRIQTADGDPAYLDAATQYAGWDAELGGIDEGNTAVVFNMTEEQEGIDWMFIDAATFLVQLNAYEARVALYDLLYEASDYGVDTSAATAAYNNPNATKEELESVINDLKYAINVAQFQEQFEGATADDPLEVTDICLVNANFSEGSINGWDCTFQRGVNATNIGYQGASYTNNGTTLTEAGSAVDDDENASYLSNFIEAWKDNNDPWKIGDAELSQTVFGLPTGMYKLTCDVIATHQWGKFDNPVTGTKLFISTDTGVEVYQEVATSNNNPEHFSITFTCPEGVRALTFGLKTENTTANWIAADNFRIYYFGETEMTLAQVNLSEAIKAAEAFAETNQDMPVYQATFEAFEAALLNAQSVAAASGSDEDCVAAQTALEAARAEYAASLKAYEKLGVFIGADGSACKLDEYLEIAGQLGDIYDTLEAQGEELKNGYSDGTITTERMNEIMDGFLPALRAAIKDGHVTPGADVTILLDNADFSEGSGATNIPGWTIKSGNITELSASYHNIEAYHYEFDFCQTISDMPAGVYNIGVQGFVRVDSWTDHGNYVGDENNMVLYGGLTNKRFKKLTDEYSETALLGNNGDDSTGSWPYDTPHTDIVDGTTVYVPNSMQGAKAYFDAENPMTEKPFYLNEVQIVHNGGDLTIGVKCEKANNLWILWDNFTIQYVGEDIESYIQMVQEEFEELKKVYEAEDAFVTKKAEDDFKAVELKVNDAKNIQTGDEALALINEIDAVMEYIKAAYVPGNNLKETYYLYSETMLSLYESSDTSFPALLDQVSSSIENPDEIADNDAINTLMASLKKGWTKYVMADNIAGASEENPADVTAVIFNPDYTDYELNIDQPTNSEGWTNEGSNGSTVYNDQYYEEIEFYNTNFNHYQTIEGLEPGWYLISNDAFYRAGDVGAMTTATHDSVPAMNSYMYAVVAGDTVATKYVHSMFDGAQVEETFSDGEVTVNLTKEDGLNGTYYVPNLMGSAYAFLTLEDYETEKRYYTNTIAAEVKEDGVLTIGVRKTELITNDWTVITNWGLAYVGKQAPVAVNSLEAKQSVKAAQFFGIDGRQQSRLQRGINIVRMADGSVQKVLVK